MMQFSAELKEKYTAWLCLRLSNENNLLMVFDNCPYSIRHMSILFYKISAGRQVDYALKFDSYPFILNEKIKCHM